MINYCLPIIKNTKKAIKVLIYENLDTYQYFEVWLDYINDIDDQFVSELVEELGSKLILVFRRQNLDEIQMSIDRRFKLLDLLDKTGAYIDLDIGSQTTELEYIRQNSISIHTITSFHDYKLTPSTPELWQIIDTMKTYEPDVFKIATHCEDENDALRLLELLRELKNQRLRTIVLGMGSKGIITRVFGTLWGNEMIFAPLDKLASSAPGQLTRKQLHLIYKELGY